jgi:hypothetical protein
MKRYLIVVLSSLLGIGVVVGAGAAASRFGSTTSVRSFARVAHKMKPNTSAKGAKSLAQLRGVNFVSGCRFSHRNTDDPIVYPGQPGKSHDHTFIGNDSTNAFSTLSTMLGATSSCRRTGDTAGYWVPTLVSPSFKPITPRSVSVYYRRRTLAGVQAFPQGFKLIAGDSKATAPQNLMVTSWNCGPQAGIPPTSTIPTCPDAARNSLTLHVQFPNCWDGVSLDSPDHKSHMAYSVRGKCPSDHPVAMPSIQINLRYPTAGGPGFALSSSGQFSGHADFFNAWNQATLQSLVDGCLNALRHCQQGS